MAQECHPPGGSTGAALWTTLQIGGVTACRGVGLLMGCLEEHLVIVQDIRAVQRKDQSWEKGEIKVDKGGKSV